MILFDFKIKVYNLLQCINKIYKMYLQQITKWQISPQLSTLKQPFDFPHDVVFQEFEVCLVEEFCSERISHIAVISRGLGQQFTEVSSWLDVQDRPFNPGI